MAAIKLDLPDRRHVHGDGYGRKQPDHPVQLRRNWDGRFTAEGCLKDYARCGLYNKLTLSGLLNFIDGLWSSCGDERIISFTTNHKDRLDPALLRPGRMDMHIHMSYCNPQGFKLLASNYLGINGYHHLFGEIEGLLNNTEVTPAQVAEELMKSEDADIALEGLVKLLKRKKLEGDEPIGKYAKKYGIQRAKRQKVETKRRSPRINRGKGGRRRYI